MSIRRVVSTDFFTFDETLANCEFMNFVKDLPIYLAFLRGASALLTLMPSFS